MTREKQMKEEYFEWIYDIVCSDQRYSGGYSWERLLRYLFETDFYYILEMDANREVDGENLRFRFVEDTGHEMYEIEYLDSEPCSVLEMMAALAMRCEEQIMGDPDVGNRTGRWFWEMISNLGLFCMDDFNFDINYTNDVIARFLNREYQANGEGGLFVIDGANKDLRNVEIWYQMMWYLSSIE